MVGKEVNNIKKSIQTYWYIILLFKDKLFSFLVQFISSLPPCKNIM